MEQPNQGLPLDPLGLGVSLSFTHHHKKLLDIALGICQPPSAEEIYAPNGSMLQRGDLLNLAKMVMVEFAAGLKKEVEAGEEQVLDFVSSPHPFDVFTMRQLSVVLSATSKPKLAVCLPLRKQKGSRVRPPLMWFDGEKYSTLEPQIHCRKVGSLSGAARILVALHEEPLNETLMAWGMQRSMLVDVMPYDQVPNCGIRPDRFESLNESQVQAVATVVSPTFKEGFLAIQGPPGCGKTHTMVEMIISMDGKIIVTAPSNAAVANIAIKLFDTGYYDIFQICLFGDNCDKAVQFLSPKHRSAKYTDFRQRCEKLEEDEDKIAREVKSFSRWLHLPEEDTDVATLARLCPYFGDDADPRDIMRFISEAQVIFCTLNSAGSGLLRAAVEGCGFTTLMLDEAGQCPEAEFFVATTFPEVKRMVVVGDPKQLPATVIDRPCQIAGYGKSWLGQVFEYLPQKVHLLDTQYRMDPAILAFPNLRFYKGLIQSGSSVHGRSPHVEKPFQLVDTVGRGREEKDDMSWKNVYEMVVIKSMLRTDPDIVRVRKESSGSRTIIITPYKAQKDLLVEEIGKLKGVGKVDVATVDSFQGQEGDIVILSTVRTHRVGFTDDPQRLNVALTRAKRVLRVVGDVKFFLSLRVGSTLRALAHFAGARNSVEESKMQGFLWSRPNWDIGKRWKTRFTERFYDCLRKMTERDKNICLNTMLAVAIPSLGDLYQPPVKYPTPSWQISALRSTAVTVRVVWVALEGFCIEAHFAGTRDECLRFVQKNRKLPELARIVTPDLLGIEFADVGTLVNNEKMPIISWPMTNNMQNYISRSDVSSLPQGNFCLDPLQEEIATAPPPLMIESRSGTGKTNVLFQHAAFYSRGGSEGTNPSCFVTVSPRLSNELEHRYSEVKKAENNSLPSILFLSLRQLLTDLLVARNIFDFQKKNFCTFKGYVKSRSSHERFAVDVNLAENEIGGVIMGSLECALQRAALSRDQYLASKRSNVPVRYQEGIVTRNIIYDEYERYSRWKRESSLYDDHDVVIRLLIEDIGRLFSSAYLDEVQDFSYATIFLICSVAGEDCADWICAGDTAQMISPGCSFTFDGLKQTFLAVKAGIERRIAEVHHLVVNYRTTKDILDVGNEILRVAMNVFPGAIQHAPPEIAVKHLGLKAVLCDWDQALDRTLSLGNNQAFICSSSSDDTDGEIDSEQVKNAKIWLDNHPFILTSIEAKGLEFDDVIVAFDLDRKTWNVKAENVACLRMLKELYVAVTRAKRRVVILVKSKDDAMTSFFGNLNLNCDLQFVEADHVLIEFDCKTSPDDWYASGQRLFADLQFKLATACFNAAKKYGWSHWAQSKYLASLGDEKSRKQAADYLRGAARHFHEDVDAEHTLEIMRELKTFPPWDANDDSILEAAMQRLPTFFSKLEKVDFLLYRGKWTEITVNELKDPSTSILFRNENARENKHFKYLVKCASEEDRIDIGALLPGLIADFHFDNKNYLEAVPFFLLDHDTDKATECTDKVIGLAKSSLNDADLLMLVNYWNESNFNKGDLPNFSSTWLLLQLFESPKVAASKHAQNCLNLLGRDIIKYAVRNESPLILHSFSRTEFALEVFAALEEMYATKLVKAVDWFMDRNDGANAAAIAKKHIRSLTDDELLHHVVGRHRLRPVGLSDELKRRKRLVEATCTLFLPKTGTDSWDIKAAANAACAMLGRTMAASNAEQELLRITMQLSSPPKMHFTEIRQNDLCLFLDLCSDPEYTSSKFGQRCYQVFKKEAIDEAVLLGGPYTKDVISIFKGFSKRDYGTLAPFDVLKSFHRKNNHQSGKWYAEFALTRFRNEELLEIVDVFQYMPEGLFLEFIKRQLFMEGAFLAVKCGRCEDAARICVEGARRWARQNKDENLLQLFYIWGDYFYGDDNSGNVQDLFVDWLLFCSGDQSVILQAQDEFTRLLVLLGPIVANFSKCRHPKSTRDENLVLMRKLVGFYSELKERLGKIVLPPESSIIVAQQLETNLTPDSATTAPLPGQVKTPAPGKKKNNQKQQQKKLQKQPVLENEITTTHPQVSNPEQAKPPATGQPNLTKYQQGSKQQQHKQQEKKDTGAIETDFVETTTTGQARKRKNAKKCKQQEQALPTATTIDTADKETKVMAKISDQSTAVEQQQQTDTATNDTAVMETTQTTSPVATGTVVLEGSLLRQEELAQNKTEGGSTTAATTSTPLTNASAKTTKSKKKRNNKKKKK